MSNCASGTTHFYSLRSLKWVACSPSLRSAQPSALRQSRRQNHQDITGLIWTSISLAFLGFAYSHPSQQLFFHQGCRNKLSGSKVHFPKSRFSSSRGIPLGVFFLKYLLVLLRHLQVLLFQHQWLCEHGPYQIQSLAGTNDVLQKLFWKFLRNVFLPAHR